MRRAGIEPDIEDVRFFPPFCLTAGAVRSRRQQFFGGMSEPGVGAFAFKKRQNMAQHGGVLQLSAASVTIKNDQRHAPEALTRNAPIGTSGDHLPHAIVTPGREPLYFVD